MGAKGFPKSTEILSPSFVGRKMKIRGITEIFALKEKEKKTRRKMRRREQSKVVTSEISHEKNKKNGKMESRCKM